MPRIHWWASDVMLNFQKSVLMKKQTHLHLDSLKESKLTANIHFGLNYPFKVKGHWSIQTSCQVHYERSKSFYNKWCFFGMRMAFAWRFSSRSTKSACPRLADLWVGLRAVCSSQSLYLGFISRCAWLELAPYLTVRLTSPPCLAAHALQRTLDARAVGNIEQKRLESGGGRRAQSGGTRFREARGDHVKTPPVELPRRELSEAAIAARHQDVFLVDAGDLTGVSEEPDRGDERQNGQRTAAAAAQQIRAEEHLRREMCW